MADGMQIASLKGQVSAEEWETRVNLAAMYRLTAIHGWTDMIFTHICARVPGPEHHFLINPYGLMFEEVTASSLVKIDIDGNIVLDNGYPINPAGFTIHSALHMAREDAMAVMHVHTDDGVAVSSMNGGLRPLNQTSMFVRGAIAYHEYEGVALNLDERARLIADLGDKDLMILRNHGTLAVGPSIADCFLRLYFLERACAIQVRAMACPDGLHMPTAAAIALTEGMSGGPGGALAWPALQRLMDRRSPGYDA